MTVTRLMLGPVHWLGLFRQNGLFVTLGISGGLALTVGLMLAMIAPSLFWGVHLGEGAFYKIMPHTVMATIPIVISAFVIVAFVMGVASLLASHGCKMGWNAGFV